MRVLYAISKQSAYAYYTLGVNEQKLYCTYFKENFSCVVGFINFTTADSTSMLKKHLLRSSAWH